MIDTYQVRFDVGVITDEFLANHHQQVSALLQAHTALLDALMMRFNADTDSSIDDDPVGDDVYWLPAPAGGISTIIVSSPLLTSPEELADCMELISSILVPVQHIFPMLRYTFEPVSIV